MATPFDYMGDPPPGFTQHLPNPPNLHTSLKAVGISTTAFAFIAVALRLYTRLQVTKNGIKLDDYMVICGLLCNFVLLGISFLHMSSGLGYHFWHVKAEDYMSPFQKWTLAGTILYAASLAFTKVSILFFYLRLAPHRWFRSLVRILITIVVAYVTTYVTICIFGCIPIAASWDLRLAPSATCLDQYTKYMALSVFNIVIDILVLILPIPVVLPLQMPMRQKVSVCLVFATGGIVCTVALRRTIMLASLMTSTDYTWDAVEQFKWCFAEVNLAIVCASAPALKPLFTRAFWPAEGPALKLPKSALISLENKSACSDDSSDYQDWYNNNFEKIQIDDETRVWRTIMGGRGALTTTITAEGSSRSRFSISGKVKAMLDNKSQYQSTKHIHVKSETVVRYETMQTPA